ncbi:MAG: signal peptidase I [Candidatus Solibacter sp.]
MTPQSGSESNMIGSFCRIYSILLYAYPRDFRLQYGAAMRQVFRDRCRDMARTAGPLSLLRFALHLTTDWLTTTVRERAAAFWSASRKQTPRGFVTEWAVTLGIYLFVTTTLVQAYVIPTGSMEGTLRVGDHMLVDRVTFAAPGYAGARILPYRELKHGDIVAFLYPEDIRQTYVKRLIGLPGDRLRLDNGQVIRNGRRLTEPYTQHIARYPDAYRDNFPLSPAAETTALGRDMLQHHVVNGEVIVPPDMLFMLGDNRDNSLDSRYWGFVPRNYVVGKPVLVYWSYDAPTADLQEWTLTHVLDVAQHFFTKTRWERTLLVPRSQPAQEAGGGQ